MGLREFRVQIFENTYDASTAGIQKDKGSRALASPDQKSIKGLTFKSRLPGGHIECSFAYFAPILDVVRWKASMTAQHLDVLCDGELAYCGLVEDMTLDRIGSALDVVARGYYVTLDDRRYRTTSPLTGSVKTAIDWALSQGGASVDWRGSFLDSATGRIEDPATVVPYKLSDDLAQTPREAIEEWLKAGDASGNRYWPAVWGTRQLEVAQEDAGRLWYARIGHFTRMTLASSRQSVFNRILVSYQDTADGIRKELAAVDDTASQQLYGLRDLPYPGGQMSTVAAGQLAAQLLAAYKDMHDVPQLALGGTVLDTGLVERPSWMVRAGDRLQCIDLELPDRPVGEAVDGRNRWLIRETTYSADSDTLDIVPDQEELTLEGTIDRAVEAIRARSNAGTAAAAEGTNELLPSVVFGQRTATPAGFAHGDLADAYPGPRVAGIQGRRVASTAPTAAQVLAWNDGALQWEPTAAGSGSGSADDDANQILATQIFGG